MAGTPHTTSLRTYALTRLALALPMVWILLTMVFLLMRVAPGDPISAALGGRVPRRPRVDHQHRAQRPAQRHRAAQSGRSATDHHHVVCHVPRVARPPGKWQALLP